MKKQSNLSPNIKFSEADLTERNRLEAICRKGNMIRQEMMEHLDFFDTLTECIYQTVDVSERIGVLFSAEPTPTESPDYSNRYAPASRKKRVLYRLRKPAHYRPQKFHAFG